MKKRPLFPGLALVILLALMAFGCGGGALPQNHGGTNTTTTTTTTGSTTSGATGGITVSAAAGGIVTSQAGNVLLNIPAKCLPSSGKISINAATTSTLPTLPQNTTLVTGTAYVLGPYGQYLNSSPSLRMVYSPSNLPTGVSERDLHVYAVVNGAWQPLLNPTVDPVNHIITVSITQFTTYAVISVSNYTGVPAYDLIDLGTLSGDTSSTPEGLSSNGYVAGISSSASGVHAFLWSQGTMSVLPERSGDVGARAYCVDASGIAGGTSIQNTIYNFPVLFSGGAATQVNSSSSGEGVGTVTAINDAGEYIVNDSIVEQGSLTTFSNFSPSTNSTALNSSGTVAGYANNTAAYWSGGTGTSCGLLTGYDTSIATAIDDAGNVVGTAYNAKASGTPIGFLYSGGTMTAISPITGDDILIPAGANDGAVVGESSKDFTTVRAFIYSGGTIADLNTLIPTGTGWALTNAVAINGSGVVLCSGNNGSATHAILLVPRPSTVPAWDHAAVRTPSIPRK